MAEPRDQYPVRAVLDHLRSVGLFDNDKVASLKVFSLPYRQLVDLGVFVAQEGLRAKHDTAPERLFHCASVSLSGGPYPCCEAECRMNSARELARYAIMFSDRVYTYNPFSQFLPAPDGTVDVQDSENVRMEFCTGLRLLQEWAPVIEAGFIFPFPHGDHYCHWCLAKRSFGSDATRRLHRAVATYKRRFAREATLTLEQDEYGYHLLVKAPKDLISYGQSVLALDALLRSLRTRRFLKLLAAGRGVPVPPRVAQGLGVATTYSADMLHSLRYGLVANQVLDTAYVTDGSADVDLLTALSGSPEIADRNRVAAKYLSTVIPFLPEIPIAPLLQLRVTQAEAFTRWRAALTKLLSSLRSDCRSTLPASDARSMYGDLIAPELARIEIIVREARRCAVLGSGRSLLGWGSALTFGIYSGFLPSELREAAKLFGATGLLKEVISQLATLKDADAAARQESYYFLWRARRLRRANRLHHG